MCECLEKVLKELEARGLIGNKKKGVR